jgi:hypothetical protein
VSHWCARLIFFFFSFLFFFFWVTVSISSPSWPWTQSSCSSLPSAGNKYPRQALYCQLPNTFPTWCRHCARALEFPKLLSARMASFSFPFSLGDGDETQGLAHTSMCSATEPVPTLYFSYWR